LNTALQARPSTVQLPWDRNISHTYLMGQESSLKSCQSLILKEIFRPFWNRDINCWVYKRSPQVTALCHIIAVNKNFFLGALEKLRKATISLVRSVRPHGTTRLPLEGFSCNAIFEDFAEIWREFSSFIKIWQEKRVLYITTYVHLR